jgi:hypothetical protein
MAAEVKCEDCGFCFQMDVEHLGTSGPLACPQCRSEHLVVIWRQPASGAPDGEAQVSMPPDTGPPRKSPGEPAPDRADEGEGEYEPIGKLALEDTKAKRPPVIFVDDHVEPPSAPRDDQSKTKPAGAIWDEAPTDEALEVILDEPIATPAAVPARTPAPVEEIRTQAGLTPRERLRAELAAIEARLADLKRAASRDTAWSIGDPAKLFGRPGGVAGWFRMLRHILSGRSTGYLVPYGTRPAVGSGIASVREVGDLQVRRRILEQLDRSGDILPLTLIFTGPNLLGWLTMLLFISLCVAAICLHPMAGAGGLIPAALASYVLWRAIYRPVRVALQQHPIWRLGFTLPPRRTYAALCVMTGAACALLATLVGISNYRYFAETHRPASVPAQEPPAGSPDAQALPAVDTPAQTTPPADTCIQPPADTPAQAPTDIEADALLQ